ncbi:hypothetical protein [Flavobacterium suzhouense]|uniref:PEGA domain-containing protein n=1 Tax=Flavobacterium suzhouense TaxID=1529638 RepID=A0ABW5NS05_9FLAO
MKKIVFFLFTLLAFACNSDDDNNDTVVCTEEVRVPLAVTVTDAISGALLTDGVTVLAVSGATSVNIPLLGDKFVGAPGANTYVVKVSAAGYADYTSATQTQEFNECGVITNNMSVLLQPLVD